MFSKELNDLTYDDIKDLVEVRREREGYYLDYKKEIGHPDKARKEIAKDISAFANSYGGFLIIGVTKEYEITGVDPILQNKGVDEWLNQVLDTNIEPQLYYPDPKIIPIPTSDKVIVVLQVPESSRKPHIVTEVNKYHIRVNDMAKSANHGQVRDMFDYSRHRTEDVKAFLEKRKLLDEEAPGFCQNENVKKLVSHITEKQNKPKPLVLFSLIPKYITEEKLKLSVSELQNWLRENSAGYYPYPNMDLYYSNMGLTPHLNGILINRVKQEGNISYFEILNNGFIEAGMSQPLTFPYLEQDQPKSAFYLTQTILYEMLLLGFAKRFYKLIKCKDEILLQVSFTNLLGFNLYGIHREYENQRFNYRFNYTNTQHNSFKLTSAFNINKLSETEITGIAKLHAEKICRAFGLSREMAFIDDKLSREEMENTWF